MLSVSNLCKRYEKFELKNVSFSLEPGYIMGFVGKNGAGKTTTLKSMLNLVHADSGCVTMFEKDYFAHELEIKQNISFMFGGIHSYPKKKIKDIANVAKRFYDEWDNKAYEEYLNRFELDADKKVEELSEGMKVKFNLALALSHNAKLLILDEPLTGLDPVSRDDLLELFQELIEDGQRSILFSTHITSDLEKCADYITFIQDGQIVISCAKDDLFAEYSIVKGTLEQLDTIKSQLIGYKTHSFGFSGLINSNKLHDQEGLTVETPSLEEIMIYPQGNFFMDTNTAFFGFVFVMFGLFNVIIFPMFYKTAYKVALPIIVSFTAAILFAAAVELILLFVPSAKVLNGTENISIHLIVLLCGIIIFALLTMLANKISVKRFEKVNI